MVTTPKTTLTIIRAIIAIRQAITKLTPPPIPYGQETFLTTGYGTVMASIHQTTFTVIQGIITMALQIL